VTQSVFIPLTDDLLVNHPELCNSRLVPYQPGVTIWRIVEIGEEEPQECAGASDAKLLARDRGHTASRA